MTLDAMHWVWNNSQSKGNARLALLYVADQVRTGACEVRVSYPDLMRALNASSKTTIRDALKAAEKLGELETVEAGSGRRAPLYKLPKAVNYIRPSGTESVPLATRSGTGSVPQSPNGPIPSGTGSVPQETRSGTESVRSGTESDPYYPYPSPPSKQEGERAEPDDDTYGIPEWARPLVDGLTNAGVIVRWPFRGTQWFPVHSMIKKSGAGAMIEHAVKVSKRTNVESAKYFIQGWQELPPLPQQPPSGARNSPEPEPQSLPDWCGKCDAPEYRWLEGDDGRQYRCPTCNPDAIGARA